MDEFQLGNVVLECRPRVRILAWMESGIPPFLPLLSPIFISFSIAGFVMYAAKYFYGIYAPYEHPTVVSIAVFCFAVPVILSYAIMFTRPAGDSFVVYENGFKYSGRTVAFAEIEGVQAGVASSMTRGLSTGISDILAPFSKHARTVSTISKAQEESSLTVVFREGKQWTLSGVIALYSLTDIEKFLDHVAVKCNYYPRGR